VAPDRWEYRQDSTVVTLTYVPHSDGDALALFSPTGDRRLTAVGEIGYFFQSDRLTATTCISPRGPGSASRERMRQNRNRYDLTPPRLGGWLLGRHNLRDWRCLVLTVRLPVANRAQLETLLAEWYTWGQEHLAP
jgi:cyanosortase A-associated protein